MSVDLHLHYGDLVFEGGSDLEGLDKWFRQIEHRGKGVQS